MGAIVTRQVTLTGTAAPVTTPHNTGITVTFHNGVKSSNNKIYLGAAGVTTSTGLHLDADQFLTLTIGANEVIYGLSDPVGVVLEVLEQRM